MMKLLYKNSRLMWLMYSKAPYSLWLTKQLKSRKQLWPTFNKWAIKKWQQAWQIEFLHQLLLHSSRTLVILISKNSQVFRIRLRLSRTLAWLSIIERGRWIIKFIYKPGDLPCVKFPSLPIYVCQIFIGVEGSILQSLMFLSF